MRSQGAGYKKIARETGLSKNTVKRWLKDPAFAKKRYRTSARPDLAPIRHVDPTSETIITEVAKLPEGWDSWQQVQKAKELMKGAKYTLAMKDLSTDAKKESHFDELLKTPLGDKIQLIRSFSEDWYSIWQDKNIELAKERWDKFTSNTDFANIKSLAKFQGKLTDDLFYKLTFYMNHDHWETTSNGAERYNRKFRKFQKARYNLRTKETISNSLKKMATENFQNESRVEFLKAS